ncbi:MAG TPA: hypothetical protein VK631_00430 [Solirubrobacteraceae bacterium]|nr:hypothetical protein [Solirubrobacteraceae bacterium]
MLDVRLSAGVRGAEEIVPVLDVRLSAGWFVAAARAASRLRSGSYMSSTSG